MGTKRQLEATLSDALDAGEAIRAWRPVVSNGRVEDSAYHTTLALLGPSVFTGAAAGTVTGAGAMPRSTNLVVVTDRRVLWCHKARLSNDTTVLGADSLAAVNTVEFVPARVALAKLRFTFHDCSVVQFDLPSDHKAVDFVSDIRTLLGTVPTAA